MPISVACRCGKAFAANDNLAGKTVKCPACQQPLTIPSAGQAPAAAPGPQAASQPAPQKTTDGKIVVTCGCGAKFAAGADLAGKRIKCPKCGQPLTVGSPTLTVTAKQQAPAVAQSTAAAAFIPMAEPATPGFGADFGLASLLDEAGVKQKATGENACPACGEFMAPEAVLCVKCGYDRKSRKKLTTETIKKVEVKKLGAPTEAAKAGAAKAAAKAGATPLNPYGAPSAPPASYSSGAELTAIDYLFIIFCGWVALVVAIIYLAQGNPKGKPMLIAWLIIQIVIPAVIGVILGIGIAVMQITGS